jgi:hypothetical protein
MSVDRVGLEPVGEGASGELVEHTSLVDVEVVADLIVAPVGQVPWVVIDLLQLD